MRHNVKNKIQITALVHPDTKIQLHQCGKFLGVPPNEAMETAIARLHSEQSKPNLAAKTSVQQIRHDLYELRQSIDRLVVVVQCLYDES